MCALSASEVTECALSASEVICEVTGCHIMHMAFYDVIS